MHNLYILFEELHENNFSTTIVCTTLVGDRYKLNSVRSQKIGNRATIQMGHGTFEFYLSFLRHTPFNTTVALKKTISNKHVTILP